MEKAMRTSSRLSIVAAVALLLLAANVLLTVYNTRQLYTDSNWVGHTYKVIAGLEEILSLAKDAETGGRGFLITGDEIYREPYDRSNLAIGEKIAEVERLTADNAVQQARFSELRKRLATRMEILDGVISLSRTQGFAAARESMLSDRGRIAMDSLRDHVGEMVEHERANLIERERSSERTFWTAIFTGLLSGLTALLAVAIGFRLVRRHNLAEFTSAEALAEQAERLRTTLSSIGDAVITTDSDGLVTNLNPVAEDLTGWTNSEAIGKPLEEVFSIVNETTRETVVNPAIRALNEGVVVGLANHTILIAKDGAERPIDDSAAPIRCNRGEIVGCVLVFRDITERKKIENELGRHREDLEQKVVERTTELTHTNRFLNALLENLREGIVACDADGVLTLFNRATREMHGLPEERVPAEKWADHYDLFQPDGVTRMTREEIPLFRALAGEKVKDVEMVIAPKGGERRILLASGQAFHDEQGKALGAVVSMHDITRRKQVEEALASAYDDLEIRVAQRTEELAASEERATNVVTSIADGLITLDKEWRITYMNPRSEEILLPLEKTDAGVRGRLFWDEFPTTVGTEREQDYRKAMSDHVAVQFEDFSEALGRWFDVRVYPSRDGLSIYFLDITTRKQAEEVLRQSEERFRMMADHMSQFAWSADATGYIYWYNQRWYDYTGTTLEEMQGWGWKKVHHPDHVDRVVARIQHSWDTGEIWEDTFPLRGKDGNYRWFLSRALPIRNSEGQIIQWFGTNTDVTSEREMADELRSLAANLSEADRRKNEFLAMLAHELRNPLAPIRNALHIMRMTSVGGSSVRSASEMMERQVGQLVRLVDDLLDVSRITRGKIELRREKVELASIIYQAVEAARPSCEKGGIELNVDQPDAPIYLNGDSARLNQAIGNLLNNSCKFTEEGGRIDLSVTEENGFAVIVVKDNGIGIAPDQLPFIFDMFVQADTSLERAVSGLGIGLTLVKNLVEMHDGTVSATSDGLGKGSEFIIRIPVLTSDAAGEKQALEVESENSAIGKLRILVVDDNIDSAESLALLLEFSGHIAAMAHDGRAAVEMATSFDPEVILLDIGLPKLNGYEAARAIRALPRGKEINLIALTGWGQPEDRDRSKAAGFDGHMVKPVDHVELMKWLEKISAEKESN